MEDRLKRLMKAKMAKQLEHPMDRKAKMDAMGDLHKMASDLMGSRLHGLKKVSVMSNDKEGLEEGLDKAKGILEGHLEDHGVSDTSPEVADDMAHEEHETNSEEESETPDEQVHEEAEGVEPLEHEPLVHHEVGGEEPHDMDEEELDRRLAHLMELKKRMAKK